MGVLDTFKSKLLGTVEKADDKFKKFVDATLRTLSRDYFNKSSLLYPKYAYGYQQLYDFVDNSDILLIVHRALRTEVFRNGFTLEEAKDTDETVTSSESEVEIAGKTREEILEFFECCNENEQSLLDVCREIEDDWNIIDDGYMIFKYIYGLDNNGEIKTKELKEILRNDPRNMGLVINSYDEPGKNDDGVELRTCPEHRDELIEGEHRCPRCGAQTYKVYYFGTRGTQKVYYFKDEVVHRSKFRPSKTYGFPPVITCWQKTRTLAFMDTYIMDLYVNQRPPKAGLFFKTSNEEALTKMWGSAQQQAEEKPNLPIVMGINDETAGGDFVKFINFMEPLSELQHTEMRNEYRQQIGAIYGVEPIFQNDMSNSGGLNNEGQQITVTNRAVQTDQAIFNLHFFPKVIEALGAKGWHLSLNPSEEQDEMAKLQRQQQTLINGKLATDLGLEAEYSTESGEVIIKDGKLEKVEPLGGSGSFFGEPTQPKPESQGKPVAKADIDTYRGTFSKAIQDEVDRILSKLEGTPSEQEMQSALREAKLNLSNNINEQLSRVFKLMYTDQINIVENELGIDIGFGVPDQNAIDLLMNSEFLQNSLSRFQDEIASGISAIVQDAYENPEGLEIGAMSNRIQALGDFTDAQAERIARDQTNLVSMAARKNSYAKSPEFKNYKFEHIGPSDSRTTPCSEEIKRRTKGGVSWDEYVSIVTEVSGKYFPTWTVNPEAPVSHWNSRHTFVRVV